MVESALDGGYSKARRIHYKILDLMEANFIEASPAPCKFVMQELGLLEENLRPKVGDAAVKAEVTESLTKLLKDTNATLADYEKMQMIVVARDPWSIENGCLTPTMKIKRARIEGNVESQVEAWFDKKDKVIWL